MLHHYLKIAIRNLGKYKIQFLINVLGLALGIAFFTLGFHWLEYETSFDSFHPNSKNIYKVYIREKLSGQKSALTPHILHRALKKDFPEVKNATCSDPWRSGGYTCNSKYNADTYFISTDSSFLRIFPQQVLYGKNHDLLTSDNEVILTESFARKYWGKPEQAVGQTVRDIYDHDLVVTAVIRDFPANSIFQGDGFRVNKERFSFSRMPENRQWEISTFDTFLLLHDGVDKKAFEEKLRTYAIEHNLNPNIYLHITPINTVKYSLGLFFEEVSFSLPYIRTFAVAGLLLLLCAFFNFLNLRFNHFFQRYREIKLRDSLGATPGNLLVQLLLEISLQVFAALLVAGVLIELCIPLFEQQFETHIFRSHLFAQFGLIALTSWGVLMLVAVFPLKRFIHKASAVTATRETQRTSEATFRRISIEVQLIISIFFILSAITLFRQTYYMNHTDWGFNKEHLLQMSMGVDDREGVTREIATLSTVKAFIPTGLFTIYNSIGRNAQTDITWEGKSPDVQPAFQIFDVGKNFTEGMEIPVLQGHFFTGEQRTSLPPVVINETAARLIGGDVVGKILNMRSTGYRHDIGYGREEFEIVGVVKDFHALSLRNSIMPLILKEKKDVWSGYYNYIRVYPGTEQQTIEAIREIIKKHPSPRDEESELITVNQLIRNLNKTEDATLHLFTALALLCILISAFGIYSISLSNMERRKKEIAIRKVMGASTGQIIGMFFREYTWLVLVANVIAFPFAFLFMNRWLEDYPYHVSISAWVFIGAFVFSTLLVILTVLTQVIRAAAANPAEVIKSE